MVRALAKHPDCELDARDLGGRTAVHLAAALGRTEAVGELWSRGCTIEAVDASGWTGEACMLAVPSDVFPNFECLSPDAHDVDSLQSIFITLSVVGSLQLLYIHTRHLI